MENNVVIRIQTPFKTFTLEPEKVTYEIVYVKSFSEPKQTIRGIITEEKIGWGNIFIKDINGQIVSIPSQGIIEVKVIK